MRVSKKQLFLTENEIQIYPDPKGSLNLNDFPLGKLRVKVIE